MNDSEKALDGLGDALGHLVAARVADLGPAAEAAIERIMAGEGKFMFGISLDLKSLTVICTVQRGPAGAVELFRCEGAVGLLPLPTATEN